MEEKHLITLKKIQGYLYLPSKNPNGAVIYLKGGPSFPDNGAAAQWPAAKKHNFALFIPDYIGHGRSPGKFSFKNCIKTIFEAENFLRGKTTGYASESDQEINIAIQDIVLVGSSWGGSMVGFLEKYRKSKIKTVGFIKAVTDWKSQARTEYPETEVVGTDRFIKTGWKHMYRGYEKSEWPEIFAGNSEEFNPLDNVDLLSNKNVFVCHGSDDKSVNWHKSENFFQKLPSSNKAFKLFDEGHSGEMNNLGLDWILEQHLSLK